VVIFSYLNSFPAATTTGTVVYTQSGGRRIYQFNSSGTITF
jgi:hypothetical protein